ncbi:MAG: hypothetical protein ACE5J3_07960 [Methanosarcinales archaeon]
MELFPKDEEKLFVVFVIELAKQYYMEYRSYFTKTRLQKLICLIADKINYEDFTRGWYRFGYYTPNLEFIEIENLSEVSFDNETVREAFDLYGEHEDIVKNTLAELREYFIQPHDRFLRWIYDQNEEYAEFYHAKTDFTKMLQRISENLREAFTFEIPYERLESSITRLDKSLKHIENVDVLNAYYKLTDLIERIELKLKLGKTVVEPNASQILENLLELYNKTILSGMVPYVQTLRGKKAELERIRYEKRVMEDIKTANIMLKKFYNDASEKNLLPSLEDYVSEIKELHSHLSPEERERLSSLLKKS